LSLGPLAIVLLLLFGKLTPGTDVLTAFALLGGLAILTAQFAWWHSTFLIDWWLNDIAESGAR
jgi:hypothetical protein